MHHIVIFILVLYSICNATKHGQTQHLTKLWVKSFLSNIIFNINKQLWVSVIEFRKLSRGTDFSILHFMFKRILDVPKYVEM